MDRLEELKLLLLLFLPRKYLQRHVNKVWDGRTDAQILIAYDDATSWANLGVPSATMRLEDHILPQMKKRGLLERRPDDSSLVRVKDE